MSKADMLEMEGVVTDILPGAMFMVKLNETKQVITCHLSGKIRTNSIRIITGDRVAVEISPYDLTKGRIIWRYR